MPKILVEKAPVKKKKVLIGYDEAVKIFKKADKELKKAVKKDAPALDKPKKVVKKVKKILAPAPPDPPIALPEPPAPVDTRDAEILASIKKNAPLKGHSTYAYRDQSDVFSQAQGAPCYASLKYQKLKAVALMFYCQKDKDEAARAYLAWILSSESPWRSIIGTDHSVVEEDGVIYGIYLGPSVFTHPMEHWMNFAIASRAWGEFPQHVELWHFCVKNGMAPETAFIYARDFRLEPDGSIYKTLVPAVNHWAINGQPDIERFSKSLVKDSGSIDTLWTKGASSWNSNEKFKSFPRELTWDKFAALEKTISDYVPAKYK